VRPAFLCSQFPLADGVLVAMDALARLDAIRAAFPPQQLFADKDFLLSPEPFAIDARLAEDLAKLGHRLLLFIRACNELYHRSVAGKQPAWIAEWLDRGKPGGLIEYGRRKEFRADLPRVLRPDLVLTAEGFTIAELDSVPGGIGLTAWLNETYAGFGTHEVLGGTRGMIDGFHDLLGGSGDVLVSRESATYRPEMEWLAEKLGGAIRVHAAEEFYPPSAGAAAGNSEAGRPGETIRQPPSLYRFFELFDLPNIPSTGAIMDAAARGEVRITPPCKAFLEEKMWFALFWMRPLREFWRRELGERHFLELQKHIPYTWLLDPTPLPAHAVIPGLEIQSWEELMRFSQKQRDLILKISGFHETAWGSRSVVLGSDAPQVEWERAIREALASAGTHPYLLQRFHKGRLVEQRYQRAPGGEIETMRGRVRLCPYYFVLEDKAELRGALATICPPDKKLLHGMRDAILAPAAVAPL
jgi:hypothetical protein